MDSFGCAFIKKTARIGVLEQGLNKHPACYESNCNLVLHDVHGDISFIEIVHLSACFFSTHTHTLLNMNWRCYEKQNPINESN